MPMMESAEGVHGSVTKLAGSWFVIWKTGRVSGDERDGRDHGARDGADEGRRLASPRAHRSRLSARARRAARTQRSRLAPRGRPHPARLPARDRGGDPPLARGFAAGVVAARGASIHGVERDLAMALERGDRLVGALLDLL